MSGMKKPKPLKKNPLKDALEVKGSNIKQDNIRKAAKPAKKPFVKPGKQIGK